MKFTIDREQYIVNKEGLEIDLPRKEFEMFWLLCSAPGKVFSRKQIFEKIWTKKSLSNERTVDVHLVNLRKKLGDQVFTTIRGVGYKINLGMTEITVLNAKAIQ